MSDFIDGDYIENFEANFIMMPTLKMENKDRSSQTDLNTILKSFKSKNGKNFKKESLNILIIRAMRRTLKFLVRSRILLQYI